MRVLTVADIHLHGGDQTEEAEALSRVIDIATDREVDMVFVLGDVFEAKSTPEQRLVFKNFLHRINRDGKRPVVIIRGNHDESGDLLIFRDFAREIYVWETPNEERITAREGDMLQVLGIPHFNAGALALKHTNQDALAEDGTSLFETILDSTFQKVQGYDGPSMVLFHGTVSGAALDNGHIPRNNGIHLNANRLAAIGCPVICGHYHKNQEVAPGVWYVGSLTRQTFGESEGDKGVMLWTAAGGYWEKEFISVSPTPMLLVQAEWRDGTFIVQAEWRDGTFIDDDDSDMAYDVAPSLTPDSTRGARIRFRYRVNQEDLPKVDLDPIKKYFEGAKELKIEQIVEVTQAVRCEEMKAAESVEDCLGVWLDSKGLSEKKQECLQILKEITECSEPDQRVAERTDVHNVGQGGNGAQACGGGRADDHSKPAAPIIQEVAV